MGSASLTAHNFPNVAKSQAAVSFGKIPQTMTFTNMKQATVKNGNSLVTADD
jgi:hypothetical protein